MGTLPPRLPEQLPLLLLPKLPEQKARSSEAPAIANAKGRHYAGSRGEISLPFFLPSDLPLCLPWVELAKSHWQRSWRHVVCKFPAPCDTEMKPRSTKSNQHRCSGQNSNSLKPEVMLIWGVAAHVPASFPAKGYEFSLRLSEAKKLKCQCQKQARMEILIGEYNPQKICHLISLGILLFTNVKCHLRT